MISVIVPAHNEARVIRRTLESFAIGADPGELEVIVVCNGCVDDTAKIAREFGPLVRVVETDIASKANALNLGDEAARAFPRIYMDADISMTFESMRRLTAALANPQILAAAPQVETLFKPNTKWPVRAYYRFWMALPFIKEGMMAAGVYAVSQTGRQRFGKFPDVIADDGFFRLHFSPAERVEVPGAVSQVTAPAAFDDLIKIKTRSRLGVYQLGRKFPELFGQELKTKAYGKALLFILVNPGLYLSAIPFAVVSVISRYRAGKQMAAEAGYRWEVDVSSRA